jgi:hypothetical protein
VLDPSCALLSLLIVAYCVIWQKKKKKLDKNVQPKQSRFFSFSAYLKPIFARVRRDPVE